MKMPYFSGRKAYGSEYKMFSNKESTTVKRRRRRPRNNIVNSQPVAVLDTFDELIAELDYSYDSLATINVIFDSLRFTYATSKTDIERLKNNTMLGDMEKELLIAYDDLSIQINHLEKNISKIEKKILKLKDDEYLLNSPCSLSSENPFWD